MSQKGHVISNICDEGCHFYLTCDVCPEEKWVLQGPISLVDDVSDVLIEWFEKRHKHENLAN